MYDKIRAVDYDYKNCVHLACSEIRAAKLAGYCSGAFTYVSGFFDNSGNLNKNMNCVRSKANEHLITYYDHCSSNSIYHINSAWDKCYNDDSPIKDFARERDFLRLE